MTHSNIAINQMENITSVYLHYFSSRKITRQFFLCFWFAIQTILLSAYKKIYLLTLFFISTFPAFAQTNITGIITGGKNIPLAYASAYLKNSTDGATADSAGIFSFTTLLKGSQLLV